MAANAIFSDLGDKRKPEYLNRIVLDALERGQKMILSILVYTFFSRMFDLMLPPVAKHSIVVA